MVTELFISLAELAILIGVAVVVYYVFLSDWLSRRHFNSVENKDKISSLEKIALIKLVSGNPKDIEAFITSNASISFGCHGS